ncbi:MAG: hypothetical protein GWP91_02730, partial [Rhodobacterales bacterium]|nr:hypothetical protein [Rhodobacterales bacterium]
HVRAFYNPTSSDPTALLELWRNGDFDALETVSWKTLTQQRGAAGVLNTGLFAAFLGGVKIKRRAHPALMFHGITQVEKGEATEGYEKIREYKNDYASEWAPKFRAVALYYVAREEEEKGQRELAIDLLVQSWLLWPNAQATDRIEHLTGRRPSANNWYGRQFPDYNLEEVDSRGRTVGLYDSLQGMQDHQVLVLCMLGGYRGNEIYDDFMRRYMANIGGFYEWIGSLHVVTQSVRRDEERPEHYAGEDLLVSTGASFQLLEDYRAFVQRAVKPPSVPTVYVLNRKGVVLHEGLLDGLALWNTLADAGRRRMEPLLRR